eukprot:m.50881 g.50881  ORF g.50881 m.50881 type:complete len:510 (+) comp10692_c0_seq1:383-1912(+)
MGEFEEIQQATGNLSLQASGAPSVSILKRRSIETSVTTEARSNNGVEPSADQLSTNSNSNSNAINHSSLSEQPAVPSGDTDLSKSEVQQLYKATPPLEGSQRDNAVSIVTDGLKDLRHRSFLVQMEAKLAAFMNDPNQLRFVCPNLDCSFHRLLVHKIAETTGLGHPTELTEYGKTIVLLKAEEMTTLDWLKNIVSEKDKEGEEPNNTSSGPPKKFTLMQRKPQIKETTPTQSGPTPSGSAAIPISKQDSKKALSFEERQQAYDKRRAEIFKNNSPPDFVPPPTPTNVPAARIRPPVKYAPHVGHWMDAGPAMNPNLYPQATMYPTGYSTTPRMDLGGARAPYGQIPYGHPEQQPMHGGWMPPGPAWQQPQPLGGAGQNSIPRTQQKITPQQKGNTPNQHFQTPQDVWQGGGMVDPTKDPHHMWAAQQAAAMEWNPHGMPAYGNMPTTHMVPGKPTGVRPPPNIAYIHGARPMMRPRPMPTDGAPVKGTQGSVQQKPQNPYQGSSHGVR